MLQLLPLRNLQFLHLASNKLPKIEGLDNLVHLIKLDLASNRIRVSASVTAVFDLGLTAIVRSWRT